VARNVGAQAGSLDELGSKPLHLATDRDVVHGDTALGQQLLNVPVGRVAGTSGPRPRSPPAESGSQQILKRRAATSSCQSPALPRSANATLPLHVVLDNYGTHKHPEVRQWLAEPANQRITLHSTPTGCSLLNMVETFGTITRQAIRRGTFTSVKDLTTTVDAYNDRCQPFTWTMTPTSCSPKSNRQRINAMRH